MIHFDLLWFGFAISISNISMCVNREVNSRPPVFQWNSFKSKNFCAYTIVVVYRFFIPPCENTMVGVGDGVILESLCPSVHLSIQPSVLYGGVLSQGGVSCRKIGSLFSMSRSQ